VDRLVGAAGRERAFVLPITLILVGLWLIFRNLEHLPLLSLERVIGMVLLYFNILTFLHLVTRGNFATRSGRDRAAD
jgi:fumarate reductase subunit D